MKERPILFSAPMVRAILAGQKTQTRRVVKPQPVPVGTLREIDEPGAGQTFVENGVLRTPARYGSRPASCPYGQPGDRLWVRETYALHHAWDECAPCVAESVTPRPRVWHRADAPDAIDGRGRWRSSIHMPRWASRITLEVTAVRVERLHDISEADAEAEGVTAEPSNGLADSPVGLSAREAFADLWASINGPESWEARPWVWVVSFKRLEEVDRG